MYKFTKTITIDGNIIVKEGQFMWVSTFEIFKRTFKLTEGYIWIG